MQCEPQSSFSVWIEHTASHKYTQSHVKQAFLAKLFCFQRFSLFFLLISIAHELRHTAIEMKREIKTIWYWNLFHLILFFSLRISAIITKQKYSIHSRASLCISISLCFHCFCFTSLFGLQRAWMCVSLCVSVHRISFEGSRRLAVALV